MAGAALLIASHYACWVIATSAEKAKSAQNSPVTPACQPRSQNVTGTPVAQNINPAPRPDTGTPACVPQQNPSARQLPIPPGASENLKTFLTERNRLRAERMQMEVRLGTATPEERAQAMEKWRQENAVALSSLPPRAQEMATQSHGSHHHVPSAPRIPENASPELRKVLTDRHALMKERVEMMNQLQNATPEERRQAMEQWRAKNASHLEETQAAASNLSGGQGSSSSASPLPNSH